MITSTTLHLQIYLHACVPPPSLHVQMSFHGHESHVYVQKTHAKLKDQKRDWNNKQNRSPREAFDVLFVRKRENKKSKQSLIFLWVAIFKLLNYIAVYFQQLLSDKVHPLTDSESRL